jgi:hypothetical protein
MLLLPNLILRFFLMLLYRSQLPVFPSGLPLKTMNISLLKGDYKFARAGAQQLCL